MRYKLIALIAATLLIVSSCSSDENSSTRDTLPEEVTRSTAKPTTTEATDLGPLPTPEWDKTELTLKPMISLNEPIDLTTRTGSKALWIAERSGTIRQIERSVVKHETSKKIPNSNGISISITETEYFQLTNNIVLDISNKVSTESERGLLGITFSGNGSMLYTSYTDTQGDTVIAKFTMRGNQADPATEQVVLRVKQPHPNHNGGQIKIGPDGFLYIALGDGGSSGDPQKHGQNTRTLLGSILRIDPNQRGEDAYTIPVGNPFIGSTADKEEIWLWGVRNPWRFSFDQDTDDLWIADVGQNTKEEINYLPRGRSLAGQKANLGWNLAEGNLPFNGATLPSDHTPPIYTYNTGENNRCSVTGGYVYRGEQIAFRANGLVDKPLEGLYLFADYCSSELMALERLADGRSLVKELNVTPQPDRVISFGQDTEDELYVLEQGGQISKLQLVDGPRALVEIPAGQNLPTRDLPSDQQVLPGTNN